MNHVDLFAGIGGFSLGFGVAGAKTTAIVEWDTKCKQLLTRRFDAPVHGDIKEVTGEQLGAVDVLTGGFPCQDISIAGGRAGLGGERSSHFWEFVRLIEETHPEWVVIENVRGLLSSGNRRDMGAVLGALGDLGYGWAYRVLDAQFFGVPQRRQRVFIVGRAGGDRDGPAQVLLEPEGVRRDPHEGGEEGQDVAGILAARTRGGGFPGTDEACLGYLQPVVVRMRSGKEGGGKGALVSERSLTIATGNDQTVFQPVVYNPYRTSLGKGQGYVEGFKPDTIHDCITAQEPPKGRPLFTDGYAVRKLTPVECERLQGFPDGWTDGFPDTTRYRMLGNAVAVPVVEWVARRLMEAQRASA